MISKKYRIERASVNFILKKGESFSSKLFIIRYTKNNKGYDRYAAVISRKISLKAVERNRFKRQIFESIRKIQREEAPSTYDIVLIPKKQILTSSFTDIEKDIVNISEIWKNSTKS